MWRASRATPTPPGHKETIREFFTPRRRGGALWCVDSGANLQCCFYWRIFAKFRPEKSDSDLYKGLFKEFRQIRQIFKNFLIKSPDFHDKFQ